ncbi:hypothetical protein F5148DRAFT_507705 [Russula earlei]|uniref:Uncharacterized protein n=1 Tax=Russula earlei TaxID=71964 RepID=A0ACC0UGB8_9AGAM|nr:hypothetical protein F5148DRAFT_507705 [Russula earlei]
MAIGKAAKWISFAVPQQSSASSTSPHDNIHSTLSIADEKQFGLENFGNTCYANSVLQALYFCSPFRDLVIQSTDISAPPTPPAVPRQANPPLLTANSVLPRRKSERGKPTSDPTSVPTAPSLVIPSAPPTLFSALRSLYVFISKNPADKGAVAPRAFIDKLRDGNELFRGLMHQDAHEFLNYLLNKIVEEIQYDNHHKDTDKHASSSNALGEDISSSAATLVSNNAAPLTASSESSHQSGTLVHRLFEGTLTSETRCLTCETVSSRDESFLDLSIDIEQNSSVTACLRQFSASEMLCQRNKFFCDSCCGLQEAEKRMKIKRLPNILALHLKRFKYQEDLKKYIKLTYRVAFPLELRLFNTIDDVEDPDRLYELFGIVVHIGSGPHHGHYVAIVKGPQSWLMFDDDKIEPITEGEIPRYFGDATAGSAYVLYYQAVDLDPTSLGIKPSVHPAVTVAGSPASATNATVTNGPLSFETPELSLPPGLEKSSAPSPAAAPTRHPPIPIAPSSPSLVTPPLGSPVRLPSRKKSLPSIRIPGTGETSPNPVTTPSRPHGGLFHLRSSPSQPRIRPSTSDGTPPRTTSESAPPVPLVPLRYVNGMEAKEKEKEKGGEKGGEKEREEERSSKEFDRRPSLWFRRRTAKPTKDDREKEKEKDLNGKDKDLGSSSMNATVATPPHATVSATALSVVPSQSDGASSVSGASSVWRRGSARVGHHVKRLSATYSNTALGEADGTAAAASSSGSSSAPSHSHLHPHSHQHYHESPGQLPAVSATPQGLQTDREASTPSSTSSSPAIRPTLGQPPPSQPSSSVNGLLPPLSPWVDADAGTSGSPNIPAWLISPASQPHAPSGSAAQPPAVLHHIGDPASMLNVNHDDDNANANGAGDDHEHLHVFSGFFAGRRHGRPRSLHGSGSGTPREQSASPQGGQSPKSPSGAELGSGTLPHDTSIDGNSSSSTSAKGKEKELTRPRRKLSLSAPLFGLGLGLGMGGRDKDRDHHHQHPPVKKEDAKKTHKFRPPSSFFGSGGSTAPLASSVP